jgi:calcium permeable stress-gated cation channel
LVTALASSASAVVTTIIEDPGSATSLLANNLPKSSNFYISYLLFQGLSIAGGAFLQIVGLILFYLLGKILDNTARKLWTRWNILGNSLGWGTVFPIYTNLAVIAITYSIISPLILIFAALAFALLYFAYLYNFLYVYNQDINTGGLIFPRAIWQTFTGLYLLEICMTGLLGIRVAIPQLVLFAITIPITGIYQVYLQHRLESKLQFIDVSDDVENGDDDHSGKDFEPTSSGAGALTTNGNERLGAKNEGTKIAVSSNPPDSEENGTDEAVQVITSQPTTQPHLDVDDFDHPAVTASPPTIWIPEDALGISKEEIRDTLAAGDIKITDAGATLDEKNKMEWSEDPPDYERKT